MKTTQANDELRASLLEAQARVTALEEALDVVSSEHLLSDALLENSEDFIFFKNRDRRFVAVSRSFEGLFGCPKSQILGKRDEDFFPPEIHALTIPDDEQVIRTGEPIVGKVEGGRLDDGNSTWVITSKFPWRDAEGEIRGLCGISKDITVQKNLQETAIDGERQMRMIGDAVPVPVGITRVSDGVVLFANAAFAEMIGTSIDQLIGANAPEYFFYENPEERNLLIEQIRREGHVEQRLSRVRRGDGTLRWVLATIRPLVFYEEQAFLGVLNDITGQKERESELERLAAEKDLLLQEVNHRVGNNLSSLLALLYRERRGADSQRTIDTFWKLGANIEALATVHRMLSEAGWSPLPLSALCVGLLDALLVGTSAKATFTVSESDIEVPSRIAHQLALVMCELVTNTLKHSSGDSGRRIDVQLLSHGGSTTLSYRDNGQGYPDSVLDNGSEGLGLQLLRGLITHSLRGNVTFANDEGALATIVFDSD